MVNSRDRNPKRGFGAAEQERNTNMIVLRAIREGTLAALSPFRQYSEAQFIDEFQLAQPVPSTKSFGRGGHRPTTKESQ